MLTASQFTLKTHHLVVKIKQLLEKDLELRHKVESGKKQYKRQEKEENQKF